MVVWTHSRPQQCQQTKFEKSEIVTLSAQIRSAENMAKHSETKKMGWFVCSTKKKLTETCLSVFFYPVSHAVFDRLFACFKKLGKNKTFFCETGEV